MHTVQINTSEVIRDVIVEKVNEVIKSTPGIDTNQVSDGYHTFGELYEHRITLWIAFCKLWEATKTDTTWKAAEGRTNNVWRTTAHSDGSVWDGWFILGLNKGKGEQITYHLPMSKWEECSFAETLILAPEWDGHSSADVLERIKAL